MIQQIIGGYYSVLTPVGLLSIAGAGIEIEQLLARTKEATTLKRENLEQ